MAGYVVAAGCGGHPRHWAPWESPPPPSPLCPVPSAQHPTASLRFSLSPTYMAADMAVFPWLDLDLHTDGQIDPSGGQGHLFSTSVLFQHKKGCPAWACLPPSPHVSRSPPSLLLFTSPPEITLVFPNPMALIFALSLFSAQTVVGIRPAGPLSIHLQRVDVSVPCVLLLLAYVCLLHPLPRRPLPCAQNKVWFLEPSQVLPPVAPHSIQTLPSALAPALLV